MARIECDDCGKLFHAPFKHMQSGTCTDCYRDKQKRIEKAHALAVTEANALPDLVGSEAQVEWALKIRANRAMNLCHVYMKKTVHEIAGDDADFAEANAEMWATTSAHWWIDNRGVDAKSLLNVALKARREREAREKRESELEAEASEIGAPSILTPSDPYSTTVATVSTVGGKVYIRFDEKLDDFRTIMRNRGFEWSAPHWVREVGAKVATHLAAEMCAVLLEERYIVTSKDPYVILLAEEGNYEKEARRRISTPTKGEDRLAIVWPRDNDYYASAMNLRGARYDGIVTVPVSSYEDVLEWAEKRDFTVMPAAAERIEKFKKALSGAKVVDPVADTRTEVEDHVGAPVRMAVPTDVQIDPSLSDA